MNESGLKDDARRYRHGLVTGPDTKAVFTQSTG